MFDIARIGKMRRQLGLTQKELARLAGVSQSLIAKIESGNLDPSYSKVIQIQNALDSENRRGKKSVEQMMTPKMIYVSPDDSVDKAISLMRSRSISQLPVLDGGKCVGSLSDTLIVGLIADHRRSPGRMLVREVMKESYPQIPASAMADIAADLLRNFRAVLVEKDGRIAGIITRADVFKGM